MVSFSNVATAQENFSFYNVYSYVDETKILHVLGEVENNSGKVAKEILVTGAFYDSNGNPIGRYTRTAEFQVSRSGESSPFEILFLNQNASARVANFTLSATATLGAEPKDPQLKILSSNSRLDLLGTFYVNALARNDGNQTATNTLLIATMYDKDGKVIAIGRALAEAVQGSADVPPGSEAAFGVVVTEKSQTYKAVKYALEMDSDQYSSEVVSFKTSGPGQSSSGGNQTQSGCLIATAAFGSEFAPQVQQLREFRDGIVMQTFAGSSFMGLFNTWYYSFSPAVAEYERGSDWARDAVRITIQPLLAILEVGTVTHNTLSSSGLSGESAMIVTGMTASALIGLVYLSPAAAVIGIKKKRILSSRKLGIILICSWMVAAALVGVGAYLKLQEIMALGTSMLVLCCTSSAVLFLSDRISRL